ncbi:Chaperone DnaJ-domain superfamily protein [Zea mays]|uniref:Chaperone DnaJ-domain superfamily protein n=1 Tax=Zea mays TaxID=4577 RepID=A0A1D6HMB5_MAIZE|nr:Chaperone DnaJ-domain superfamily protein [Zea mays]
MDAGGEKCGDAAAEGGDLYAVLGLKKECSEAELKVAYRKLAKKWHPDKCSSSSSVKHMEEAKEKFQEIQGAYSGLNLPSLSTLTQYTRLTALSKRNRSSLLVNSLRGALVLPSHCSCAVLSDANKRLLYDVGVYDDEDDEESMQGMGDFIGEMAQMMSQAQPTRQESFEELQQLFVDMFQSDIDSGFCNRTAKAHQFQGPAKSRTCSTSPSSSPSPPPTTAKDAEVPSCNGFNKRGSSALDSGKPPKPVEGGAGQNQAGFCFGVSDTKETPKLPGQNASRRRNGRKQKLSSKHDVSSEDETAAGS